MDMLTNLGMGLQVSLQPMNVFYCFIGTLLGTAIGVLPGLGPLATISMLLPLTYALDPVAAIIMLAGIYYGAQYGGSTTAILVNLPGESSSVVTAIDGHKLALAGRAGAALAVAALASVFAGIIATFVIGGFSPILARVALSFGPGEYFSLMVLGLVAAIILSNGSLLKAIGMVLVGISLGLVGTDAISGTERYTFGVLEMSTGIEFVAIAMGIFAFADIIANISGKTEGPSNLHKISRLWPSREDMRRSAPAAARGTLVGSILGLLPGGGAALASFSSYTLEKRVSSRPQEFGQGAIEGVAGPEAANNAAAQTSFIPMLTLGVPSNGTMALMMGALMIHNIAPGPQLINQQPVLFWGLVTSMLVGNVILVLLNLPLVGIWVKLISVPYRFLVAAILMFCMIGLYSIQNQTFEIMLAAIFGVIGYLFMRMKCEPAPLLLGFILGPMLESNLNRSMLLSHGNPATFVTRPLSAVMLGLAAILLISVILPQFRRSREEVFESDS